MVKSLFVKYGVWFARTAETYIKLFYLLSIFPFLWKASFLIKKNFYLIVYIKFWIVEWIVIAKKKIIIKKLLTGGLINWGKIFKIINFGKNFVEKTFNFWESEVSFVNTSKYVQLGYKFFENLNKSF